MPFWKQSHQSSESFHQKTHGVFPFSFFSITVKSLFPNIFESLSLPHSQEYLPIFGHFLVYKIIQVQVFLHLAYQLTFFQDLSHLHLTYRFYHLGKYFGVKQYFSLLPLYPLRDAECCQLIEKCVRFFYFKCWSPSRCELKASTLQLCSLPLYQLYGQFEGHALHYFLPGNNSSSPFTQLVTTVTMYCLWYDGSNFIIYFFFWGGLWT